MNVTAIVGTAKGAWVFRSDAARQNWSIEGPLFKGWKVTAASRARDGRYLLGTASEVYGAAIQVSRDLKEWQQAPDGPKYPEGGPKLKQIWTIHTKAERLYAGVDEAGMFASDDGLHWQPLNGLNNHPTRGSWFPGNGGLCAHAVLHDGRRLWCGISAVGVFRSDDGGETWRTRNQGAPIIIEDKVHKDIGS